MFIELKVTIYYEGEFKLKKYDGFIDKPNFHLDMVVLILLLLYCKKHEC